MVPLQKCLRYSAPPEFAVSINGLRTGNKVSLLTSPKCLKPFASRCSHNGLCCVPISITKSVTLSNRLLFCGRRIFHFKPQHIDNSSNIVRYCSKRKENSEVPVESTDVSVSVDSDEEGSLQGAVALIIGTSVGAGILAIPARTLNTGFVPTVTTMGMCWCFLLLEALLLAEVNVMLLNDHRKKGSSGTVSLCAMAENTLGPVGGVVSAFTYSFLSYTTTVAYIAKSGDVLLPLIHITPSLGACIFTVTVGSIILFGGTKLADYWNQILTVALIVIFVLIITQGAPITDWSGLEHMNWEGAPATVPVLFFALVYHDLIPVLCVYLKGNMRHIRLALVLGSFIPLIMFIAWDAVILCIAPFSRSEDPLNVLIRLGGTTMSIMLGAFSLLALATSLIGTLLGFLQFSKERFNGRLRNKEAMRLSSKLLFGTQNTYVKYNLSRKFVYCTQYLRKNSQVISSFILLVPSLVASTMVSDAFMTSTDLAGGYGMAMLYGLFPPIMAWSLHEKVISPKDTQAGSLFSLPKPHFQTILAASGTFAIAIMISQLVLDFNFG